MRHRRFVAAPLDHLRPISQQHRDAGDARRPGCAGCEDRPSAHSVAASAPGMLQMVTYDGTVDQHWQGRDTSRSVSERCARGMRSSKGVCGTFRP